MFSVHFMLSIKESFLTFLEIIGIIMLHTYEEFNTMKQKKEGRLSYYSVWGHRIFLAICLLVVFIICIFVFPWILKLIYSFFSKIPGFFVGNSCEINELSLLPDFLGGLCGILVGVFLDATIVSRWIHLKKYTSLLGILNQEFDEIKKLEKKWSVEKCLQAVKKNIYNKKFKSSYEEKKKNLTAKQIQQLKKNECLIKKIYEEQEKEGKFYEYLDELLINYKPDFEKDYVDLYDNLKGDSTSSFDCNNMNEFYQKFDDYINLDINEFHPLKLRVLPQILNSDNISIFYNLPRYLWLEEKGNFAKKLLDIQATVEDFNYEYEQNKVIRLLLLYNELLIRINDIQSVTGPKYVNQSFKCMFGHLKRKEDHEIKQELRKYDIKISSCFCFGNYTYKHIKIPDYLVELFDLPKKMCLKLLKDGKNTLQQIFEEERI